MQLLDFISYEALEFSFSDEGKVLERDISAVHILAILYARDKMIDFTVNVFAKDYIDGLPIYTVLMPLESGEVLSIPAISPLFVLKMFDQKILQFFSAKGLYIDYNPDWSTNAKIHPLSPDLSIDLYPEKY